MRCRLVPWTSEPHPLLQADGTVFPPFDFHDFGIFKIDLGSHKKDKKREKIREKQINLT